MTFTRNQAKEYGPNKLVSEPNDGQEASPHHSIDPENDNQDDNHLSIPDQDHEAKLWQRQWYINEKTSHTLEQLRKAHQELHQKFQENFQELNGKIDLLFATLESFMLEIKNNKNSSTPILQEPMTTTRSALCVFPFQRTSTRNTTETPPYHDQTTPANTRVAPYIPPYRRSLAKNLQKATIQKDVSSPSRPYFLNCTTCSIKKLEETNQRLSTNTQMSVSSRNLCVICWKLGSKICSRCKSVRYYSEACQLKHLNAGHKSNCKPPIPSNDVKAQMCKRKQLRNENVVEKVTTAIKDNEKEGTKEHIALPGGEANIVLPKNQMQDHQTMDERRKVHGFAVFASGRNIENGMARPTKVKDDEPRVFLYHTSTNMSRSQHSEYGTQAPYSSQVGSDILPNFSGQLGRSDIRHEKSKHRHWPERKNRSRYPVDAGDASASHNLLDLPSSSFQKNERLRINNSSSTTGYKNKKSMIHFSGPLIPLGKQYNEKKIFILDPGGSSLTGVKMLKWMEKLRLNLEDKVVSKEEGVVMSQFVLQENIKQRVIAIIAQTKVRQRKLRRLSEMRLLVLEEPRSRWMGTAVQSMDGIMCTSVHVHK